MVAPALKVPCSAILSAENASGLSLHGLAGAIDVAMLQRSITRVITTDKQIFLIARERQRQAGVHNLRAVRRRSLPFQRAIPTIERIVGMSRNGLYLVIAALVVVTIGLSIYIYHEETRSGVEIEIGEDGISVQES